MHDFFWWAIVFARVFLTSKITVIVESAGSFFPHGFPCTIFYSEVFCRAGIFLEIVHSASPPSKYNGPSLTRENRIERGEGIAKACGT